MTDENPKHDVQKYEEHDAVNPSVNFIRQRICRRAHYTNGIFGEMRIKKTVRHLYPRINENLSADVPRHAEKHKSARE